MVTRLSSIHPYPAMIADPLAEHLAKKFVTPGMRVLDPFCGTGRTLLAAAANGANCIGFDVNPHAVLLVKAKSASYQIDEIDEFLKEFDNYLWDNPITEEYHFEQGRKVDWFSEQNKNELSELLFFLNSKKRSENMKVLAGAVLSATTREVSYCRNDRWKLHRIPASKRMQPSPSAKATFRRRLNSAAKEIKTVPYLEGNCRSYIGNSQNLKNHLVSIKESLPFDLVITSPPYGDSRTTVQYGGMSSICLGSVSHISGFEHLRCTGGEIDGKCIGGRQTLKYDGLNLSHEEIYPYWKGGKKNKALKRICQYLFDLKQVCIQIGSVLCRGGHVIIVIARRRAGHWRLYTDRFIEDIFSTLEINLVEKRIRKIKKKILPRQINPYARSQNSKDTVNNLISTMSEEFVLVFKKGVT